MTRTATIAALFLLSASLAFAQPFGGRRGPGPGGPGGPGMMEGGFLRGPMAAALNLSDSQKEQIRSIFENARTSLEPVMQQARENREAAQAAVREGKSDAELQQIADTGGRLHAQIQGAMLQAQVKALAVLTPDQRQKLDEMRQEARQRFENRQERRQNRQR